jgi:hypothetical protein
VAARLKDRLTSVHPADLGLTGQQLNRPPFDLSEQLAGSQTSRNRILESHIHRNTSEREYMER